MNKFFIQDGLDEEIGFHDESKDCFKDEVGGVHDEGLGWNPYGAFCGECSFMTCSDCVSRYAGKEVIMNENKYVIRIYDVGHEAPPYIGYGDKSVDDNPMVTSFSSTKEELVNIWNKLLPTHEGMAYTVYDIWANKFLIGGAFDPDDVETIEHYGEEN